MRDNWTYKTFGEVGSFLRGKSIQKANFVEKGMPCIHYGQIHTKFGIAVDKHLSEIPLELYNKSILASQGDVIIAITSEDLEGSCKSTAWLGDYDVAVSAHAAVYKHNLNPKFIAYYLRSNSFYVEKEKYARGFKVMEIKPNDIARIPLPIPPLSEQQSIVAELDKINELISLKKAQLKDLDALAQSIFYDMFGDPIENEKGWEVKKLGEIAIEKLSYGSGASAVEYDGETRYVRITDITDGGELDASIVSPNVFDNKYLLNDGDILFARSGATVGKTFLYTPKYGRCIYAGYLIRYIPDKKVVLPLYVFALTKTTYYKSFISNSQRAVAQPNINAKQYGDLQIPLPPLSLQQEFAKRIELIEQQKAQISSTIKDLETLLASRMQYWFD